MPDCPDQARQHEAGEGEAIQGGQGCGQPFVAPSRRFRTAPKYTDGIIHIRSRQLPGNIAWKRPYRRRRTGDKAHNRLRIRTDSQVLYNGHTFPLAVHFTVCYGSFVFLVVHGGQVKKISLERKASKCAFAPCEGGRVRVL